MIDGSPKFRAVSIYPVDITRGTIICHPSSFQDYFIAGLVKPNFFSPFCTSGQLINSFHNSPVR